MQDKMTKLAHSVETAIGIDATKTDVWEVLADYCGMYTWATNIEDTVCLSKNDRGLGAVRRNVAKGFGAVEQTVTIWNEGNSFTYLAEAFGPFGQTLTEYKVRRVDGGTSECVITLDFDLASDQGPTPEQLSMKLQAGLTEILQALKKRVETGKLVREYK